MCRHNRDIRRSPCQRRSKVLSSRRCRKHPNVCAGAVRPGRDQPHDGSGAVPGPRAAGVCPMQGLTVPGGSGGQPRRDLETRWPIRPGSRFRSCSQAARTPPGAARSRPDRACRPCQSLTMLAGTPPPGRPMWPRSSAGDYAGRRPVSSPGRPGTGAWMHPPPRGGWIPAVERGRQPVPPSSPGTTVGLAPAEHRGLVQGRVPHGYPRDGRRAVAGWVRCRRPARSGTGSCGPAPVGG